MLEPSEQHGVGVRLEAGGATRISVEDVAAAEKWRERR
jgi:hypothetical protein